MRRIWSLLFLLLGLAASAAPAARVVAVGDIHGEIDGLDSVLEAAGLIDQEGGWTGADATLVQTGDLTDRGPRVRAVMDRLRSLERQAPAGGGRVVPLLGNHEISVLSHIFDETSTPREVYHQTWADFASDKAERVQKRAYTRWFRWWQKYPGCVKEENRAWADTRSAWLEDHPPGFVEFIEALSPEGEYGAWLRGLGVAAVVDDSLFLHGGISPTLLELGYGSVEEINEAARAAIAQLDLDRRRLVDEEVILPFSTLWEAACAVYVEMLRLEKDGRAKSMVRRAELEEINARLPGMEGWFPTEAQGPLWYRGLATGDEAELTSHIEALLAAFDVRRVAVGHTPQTGAIRARFAGRVFLIDTAMAYAELGGRPAALEIVGDRVTAIYPDERVVLVDPAGEAAGEAANTQVGTPIGSAQTAQRESAAEPAGPAGKHVWIGPDGEPLPFHSVDEVLDFLATAKVVGNRKVDTGVTLPRKLTLERGGVRSHAIFHSVAIEKRQERLHGGKVVNFFRDHYANNVAAFELSRMLGLSNVPPAVERRIGRERGSVQLWIEGSRTEADRRKLGIAPDGTWRLTSKDMQVFDNLINNIDRNQGNILYDRDWNLWFIDHTRTFGRLKELPSPARVRRCSRRLYQALRDLDEEEVHRRLRPYIGIYEIRGLMARRDLLLELIEKRISDTSEMAVLFDYDDATALAVENEQDPDIPEGETTLPIEPDG